jgi:Domain of unknown function (DUF4440)
MIRALLGLLALIAAPASAEPAPPALAAELRAHTQALLDAVAPGDRGPWERLLDPAFLHLDENGTVRTKAELLAEISPLPAGLAGSIRVDSFRAELHGDVAIVAHEDQERLDYHGQHLATRFRSLDTWRRTPGGWRLIGQHVAAVLRDPPAATLSRAELCAYDGRYALTDAIVTTIRCDGDALVAERTGRPAVRYRPELRDLFFAAGQPRSRRIFLRDPSGRITGFADRREGEDIVWRRRD